MAADVKQTYRDEVTVAGTVPPGVGSPVIGVGAAPEPESGSWLPVPTTT